MPLNEPPAPHVRFGAFEVDLLARELRRHGRRIKLPDQPFQVLAMLLERPGQVVTRDELQKRLWSDDTFVDFDRGLNKAINRLREALGDDADHPRLVETLPKRGYRFIATVEPLTSAPIAESAPITSRRPLMLRAASVLLAVAAAVVATLMYFRGTTHNEPLLRSSLLPPSGTSFLPYNFVISPDGTQLIFSAANADGTDSLWVRTLSVATARRLERTNGGRFPFWSPDGRKVGFFADRKLKTVDVVDGAIQTLCEARRGRGGTGSAIGVIVFKPDVGGPLYRVAASGGTPQALVLHAHPSAGGYGWPTFLPDGRHFLYVAREEAALGREEDVDVASIDSTDATTLVTGIVGSAQYASNHLFFVRDGTLMAQPFSPGRLKTTGPAMAVAEHEIETIGDFFPSGFSLSVDGLLVFQSSMDFASRLTWVDETGHELGSIPRVGDQDPALSPNGRLVAVSCDNKRTGARDICLYDLERDVTTQLTHGGTDRFPVWSRDGKTVEYLSGNGRMSRIYEVAVDGSSRPQQIATLTGVPTDILPDGRLLFFGGNGGDVALATYSKSTHQVNWLGPGSEGHFSPDGRWILHGGQDGITVRRFPDAGSRVQISEYGGSQPRWSRDGRHVFYVTGNRKMMRVGFKPSTGQATAPELLFQTRIVAPALVGFQYDVAPDGRFLINSLPAAPASLTMLSGWSSKN